jgi:hypothetical protein
MVKGKTAMLRQPVRFSAPTLCGGHSARLSVDLCLVLVATMG